MLIKVTTVCVYVICILFYLRNIDTLVIFIVDVHFMSCIYFCKYEHYLLNSLETSFLIFVNF